MDVRFISTTSNKLSELAIVSGQLIYLSDISAAYYDMGSTRRLVSSLKIVPSLPSTSAAQENIIYGIVNGDNRIDSWIWDASASTYRQLSGYVATTDAVGLVKPDGITITVDANGRIKSHAVVDEFPATLVTFDNTESGLASTEVQSALTEVAAIANQQSDWAQASTAAVDYIKNKPELSTVATSGEYSDLLNKPVLGTASAKDVPVSGNASTAQVVMGDDTRLTDARNAADVYSWAKAPNKPTYTAAEVGALASTSAGANNGVATLDSSGKLTASQLPLGNASTNAYYGDKGKTAYDHSQLTSGNPHNVSKSDLGLENVGNFKAVSTVANQGLTDTEKSNARANIGAGDSSLVLGNASTNAYYGDKGKTAYDHSQLTSGNPHGVTKSDVGLGDVGNFKAVSTAANQGLSSTEQSNARANIGAGTSDLILGNASTNAYYGDKGKTAYDHSQVTSGNPHSVTKSDVGLGNVGNFKAVSTAANQRLTSTEKANAIANIGASTFSGSYNDLSNKPTIPTVNDGTLTIKRNGTAVASFTANSSTAVEADISVPTKTSDLTNNSNFISGSNLAAAGFGYGTCDTAGSTAAKTATLANFALTTGALVSIKFTNAVPVNATLSINSTTAKNIYYKGAAITAGIINAGDTALFVYSGQYQLLAVDSLIGTALITE